MACTTACSTLAQQQPCQAPLCSASRLRPRCRTLPTRWLAALGWQSAQALAPVRCSRRWGWQLRRRRQLIQTRWRLLPGQLNSQAMRGSPSRCSSTLPCCTASHQQRCPAPAQGCSCSSRSSMGLWRRSTQQWACRGRAAGASPCHIHWPPLLGTMRWTQCCW